MDNLQSSAKNGFYGTILPILFSMASAALGAMVLAAQALQSDPDPYKAGIGTFLVLLGGALTERVRKGKVDQAVQEISNQPFSPAGYIEAGDDVTGAPISPTDAPAPPA